MIFLKVKKHVWSNLPGPLSAGSGLADGLDLVEVGGLDAAAVALPGVPLDVVAVVGSVGSDLGRGGRIRNLALLLAEEVDNQMQIPGGDAECHTGLKGPQGPVRPVQPIIIFPVQPPASPPGTEMPTGLVL